MNKQFLFTLFLIISPLLLGAQENSVTVKITKATGTSFSLARGSERTQYSKNLKDLSEMTLLPGDIITTSGKTSVEISINDKKGRIKMGEKTTLIFAHATEGESSAFILKKGLIKVQKRVDTPGNSIFIRTETLSAEIRRGSAGVWLHPRRRGSLDTKTEVFCLSGKSDIFVLKKAPDNNWYDKDPEYNEHFLLSGSMLSVRSDQAPIAVEELMSSAQKEWWRKFDFGEEKALTEETPPEEKTDGEEVAKEEESTPPEKEDEVLDDEVKESFKERKPIREKLQKAGIATMAGSSAMFLSGIITYAAVPPESKDIGTVLTAVGGGGALTGLIIFFTSYAFPSANPAPAAPVK